MSEYQNRAGRAQEMWPVPGVCDPKPDTGADADPRFTDNSTVPGMPQYAQIRLDLLHQGEGVNVGSAGRSSVI